MKLYLFDDRQAREFEPFALTRPAGELLYGHCTLRQRSERALGLACAGHWTDSALVGFDEHEAPRALGHADLTGPCILLSSRVVLDAEAGRFLPESSSAGATPLEVGGRRAGWLLGADTPVPAEEHLYEGAAVRGEAAAHTLPGSWIDEIWDLMAGNSERLLRDLTHRTGPPPSADLPGVYRLGDHPLILGPGVHVEPGVLFDTRDGPIQIEGGVELRAPLRLAGPAFIGRGCVLFGGAISAVSLGPVCKVRGEVEETVILGYSNKAHDGFLGHAYLGRWVNLGALTTNSDLKNNYGPVRLQGPQGPRETGLTKVGCFLGDHVKTGIGTMLNTGTVVGAGSNLFGGVMPPSYVPPFSWGSGGDLVEYRFDKFLEVAQTVHARRKLPLSDSMAQVLQRSWLASARLRNG